ncbi:hypothetical protein AWC38_SpisGene23944 [Stylophora pistillata]|uniref:ORC1/DEAH AAA+ ATPase domain-containing protein n=1 Tax=Stylophora pistillata TaxID=50429 RepID=A0A2B4R795_STYPI|nr:hypothetical protein AWC38_SpisGene23944 [Stylophora pistillata]
MPGGTSHMMTLEKSEIDKPTFDRYMQLAKEAFKALGVKTDPIDAISGLTESDFPTKEVRNLEQDSTVLLPPSCLCPMVPHFAGGQRECEEIIGHLSFTSTRIVSIWGSLGFGKTFVETAVGHKLQANESPVYFFSLRGLNSKTDLISKLFSFFGRTTRDDLPQQLPIDEDLLKVLTEISDEFVMILDNADDLLEIGAPNVKESLEFMNVHFEGHQGVGIGSLDESFSQALVSVLLSNAITASDCEKVAKICGHVPLAIKLLCSTISEDNTLPSQFLEEWKESVGKNIVDLLDNPDYPSNLRSKCLFKSFFSKTFSTGKRGIGALSILSEDFNLSVAAAVMGVKTNLEAKILHRLRRKSLLDSGRKAKTRKLDTHITHPLRLEIICVVGSATNHFFDKYTENSMTNSVIQIATELQKPTLQRSHGLWKLQRNIRTTLKGVFNPPMEATKLSAASISYHKMAITEYKNMSLETHSKLHENLGLHVHQEELLTAWSK